VRDVKRRVVERGVVERRVVEMSKAHFTNHFWAYCLPTTLEGSYAPVTPMRIEGCNAQWMMVNGL
jgi:hypothetical protein